MMCRLASLELLVALLINGYDLNWSLATEWGFFFADTGKRVSEKYVEETEPADGDHGARGFLYSCVDGRL
jgi:hypothetical protein